MTGAPCDKDLEIERLREELAAVRKAQADAGASAKEWMTKYSIERELADERCRDAERWATEAGAAKGQLIRAQEKIDTLVMVLGHVVRSADD